MKIYAYKSTSTLSKIIITFLGVYLLLTIIGVVSGLFEYNLLNNYDSATDNEIESNDLRQIIIGGLQFLSYLPSIILFLIWLNRYSKNTHALSSENMVYTPGWTVGYFFIPILNLFRPYQAIKELCKFNCPSMIPLLSCWWGVWLASTIIGKASFRLSIRAKTIEDLITANKVTILSDFIDIVGVTLMILLVYYMTRHQLDKERNIPQTVPLENQPDNGIPVPQGPAPAIDS